MTHIEVLRYGEPPCGGRIARRPLAPLTGEGPRRSLPIFGAAERPAPTEEWVCEGCGRRWEREPRLEEAL